MWVYVKTLRWGWICTLVSCVRVEYHRIFRKCGRQSCWDWLVFQLNVIRQVKILSNCCMCMLRITTLQHVQFFLYLVTYLQTQVQWLMVHWGIEWRGGGGQEYNTNTGLLFPGGNQYQRFVKPFHKTIANNIEEFARWILAHIRHERERVALHL